MTQDSLPPFPPRRLAMTFMWDKDALVWRCDYDMQPYIRTAVLLERERCAAICDTIYERLKAASAVNVDPGAEEFGALECATSIRNQEGK